MTAAPGPHDPAVVGRILVVDDNETNRVLLQEMLELDGHRVVLATDGPGALARVAEEEPDLLLLDVNMPGMDGLEVCRRLRSDPVTASLPIILVTALADRSHRLNGIKAGANDYLTKPIDRADLLLRVHNALQMRRLHRDLARQYGQLQRLEQLRDSLVHMLVHDLRSPLTGVAVYLELATDRVRELGSPDLLADFESMGQSVRMLTDMVSNVLDVSRFEADAMPLRLVAVDLRSLVAEAIATLGRSRHATVHFAPPPSAVPAMADPDAIRRVIANLVGNALKFTPRGGVVVVEVGAGSVGPEVRVTDTGPGIPAEHHHRIFEKFGQVAGPDGPKIAASGLGLTFCKLAVEAHSGKIGLESEVGTGSTFWVSLPPQS